LHASISWAEEAMLFLMVGSVFLGSVPVAWSGRHIRMDAVLQLLPPRVRDMLAVLADLVFMATALALVIFAYPTLRQLVAFDQRSLAANIPIAIPQSAIPVGLLLMAFVVAGHLATGLWRAHVATPTMPDMESGEGKT
jgi:TRAP-type C4-dicarboxylate transport system permease small subunit